MTQRLRLIQMLDDRALEMHSNHATHCAFNRAEMAALIDGARDLKVQLDNALSSCEAVRDDLRREQAECFKRREERDAAVKKADERLTLIAQICEEATKDKLENEAETKRLQRQLDEYKQAINSLRKERDDALRQGSNNCIERDNWKRRCDDHRTAYRELKALADRQTAQLHEAKQTETTLRQRLQVVEGIAATVRVADLPPAPVTSNRIAAGGASSSCNNSIDAAKAQQSPLQELCRDRLRQTIKDGTWTQFPELRQYVAEIAINGEPNQ